MAIYDPCQYEMALTVKRPLNEFLAHGLIALTLAVLIFFSYGYFRQVPYAGFNFNRGRIHAVYVTAAPGAELYVGDELVQIGSVPRTDFAADLRQTLFDGVEPGQVVDILVQRNGKVLSVAWLFPGFNRPQFLARLFSAWWLPYPFWILAVVTVLFLRPRDSRRRLLVAFNLLTAVWLAAGSGPSGWHVWSSATVLRAAIWFSLPVYWHLHWLWPEPLRPLPAVVPYLAYLGGGTLAALAWFQRLPQDTYLIGFILAVGGSLALLIAHAAWRPAQRRQLRLLVNIAALVILPAIVVVTAGFLGGNLRWASLVLLGLPFIPAAYLYAVYYDQPGQLQLRANRLIALYAYLILVGPAIAILVTLPAQALGLSDASMLVGLAAAVAAGIVTAAAFPAFARLVERCILGMPLPPASLLESYAMRIATRLDKASLVKLLRDEVLASLLVRRSAIVLGREDQARSVLFSLGVKQEDLPEPDDLPALLAQAGVYRPVHSNSTVPQPCPWVRLILPLSLGGESVGLWLLGRRDPDDFYSPAEIPAWQALAAQTAVALANIVQAENLHALYQADIDYQERARTDLALVLHDEILTQVTALGLFADKECVPPQFHHALQALTVRCREIVYGLRPAALNYGLAAALRDLAESVAERSQGCTTIQCHLPGAGRRYQERVEQHLYRIVQQAVENALQHASAPTICISGRFDADRVCLVVADDGKGFAAGESLELPELLAHKHFGLAGMHERAALIGAELQLFSIPERGTQVKILWSCQEGGG